MAINYTISYTFTPGTTIASSQVNTNFSDNANTWQGLEAKTKSIAALQIDATPTVAADVVRKDYVDHLMAYRRPRLRYSSATVVALETGLTGQSGQAAILFPDGNYRTDSTTTRINFDITRNAALSGTAQSGLRTTLSEANNTWYALYAVKVSDSSTNFVVVGDTLQPTQANFTTITTNFGTNSWVYLGMARNGDSSATAGDLLMFSQTGNFTVFGNKVTANTAQSGRGIRLSTTAGATSLTYSAAIGTSGNNIPATCIDTIMLQFALNPSGNINAQAFDTNASGFFLANVYTGGSAATTSFIYNCDPASGGSNATVFMRASDASSVTMDLFLAGFYDSALGVGPNPVV